MALRPCKECGKEISTEAKSCPNCGKTNPTGTPTNPLAMGCLVLIVVGVIGSLLTSTSQREASTVSTTIAPEPVPAPPLPLPGSQWSYSHSPDEMTGKVSDVASLQSENVVEFDFPYQGAQHARLSLRRHPRYGADVIFSIERGQLLCASYEGCSVLVRFDEEKPTRFSANPPADHSTETIFIEDYDSFVSRLRRAKQIRVSPQVYQQGTVVFTFDVSGFDTKQYRGQ